MSTPSSDRRRAISRRRRAALALCGVIGVGLLATAATLTPDERGLGTHEQIGLAPCWIHARFGVACPSCGMTTAWAHAMHGRLWQAAQCSAGGILLWLIAMVAAPWALIAAARGEWPVVQPTPQSLLWCGTFVMIVTLMDWLRRVASAF